MSAERPDSGGIISSPVRAGLGIVVGVLAGAAGWWADGFLPSALAALSVVLLGTVVTRRWDRRHPPRPGSSETDGPRT